MRRAVLGIFSLDVSFLAADAVLKGTDLSGGASVPLILLAVLSGGYWLATADAVVRRRPTLHAGHRSGAPSIWVEPAEQPLFHRRSIRKREVEVGRRAVEVSAQVLEAVAKAQADMSVVPHDSESYMARYQAGLNQMKADIGGAWHEVLIDLEQLGALPDIRERYEITVNYTGLDSEALTIQAIGRRLMRQHGVEPDG